MVSGDYPGRNGLLVHCAGWWVVQGVVPQLGRARHSSICTLPSITLLHVCVEGVYCIPSPSSLEICAPVMGAEVGVEVAVINGTRWLVSLFVVSIASRLSW